MRSFSENHSYSIGSPAPTALALCPDKDRLPLLFPLCSFCRIGECPFHSRTQTGQIPVLSLIYSFPLTLTSRLEPLHSHIVIIPGKVLEF